MPTIGVVLSGCGFLDGSEIHEATLTLMHLDRAGAKIVCMAPDEEKIEVIDHFKKEPTGENRNVLAESGRIARTEIRNIADVQASELDALIFPGGFGAAKNLCSWAVEGPDCSVNEDVQRLILDMHDQDKPQGFICIAPVLAARVLGSKGPKLTIGNDPGTAAAIEQCGAAHVDCPVDDAIFDEKHKVATTPAYMLGPSISYVEKGIGKLVDQVVDWCK